MGRVPYEDPKIRHVFDGKKKPKLGTNELPAELSVQTEERSKEIAATFQQRGWVCRIEVDPDRPEDLSQMQRLLNPPKPKTSDRKIGRNEPCPCGSGKKHKKCCG